MLKPALLKPSKSINDVKIRREVGASDYAEILNYVNQELIQSVHNN